ncbi:hypothetical protein BV22DRAFT_1195478 [Leucogyrophana mollusca]|uniref:Uncharacterized protein n=1 Tax=Leucogyrophana mollusca TaxID=85980 RepID=A0ACB8BHM4_9AGAM|nr:hypothetical protein BV22DRAFT_1195478 [Leucogyrophana mollusca]
MAAGTMIATTSPYRNPILRIKLLQKIKLPGGGNASRARLLSLKSWLRRLRGSAVSLDETLVGDMSSSSSSTLVESPRTRVDGDEKKEKVVRFADYPTYLGPRKHRRGRRASFGPKRTCMVKTEAAAYYHDSSDDDEDSVYEDCLSHYVGFEHDYEELLNRECYASIERSKRQAWQLRQVEPGLFDPEEYASECFSKFLKARDNPSPRKLVFEHPATLPWPSRVTPPPIPKCEPPPPPLAFTLAPGVEYIPQAWHVRLRDRIEGEIIVCSIGLLFHFCLLLYFIYHVIFHVILRCGD